MCCVFSDGKTEMSTLSLYLLMLATWESRGLKERALELFALMLQSHGRDLNQC